MMNAIAGGSNFANIQSFVSSNARTLQSSLVNFAAGQRVMRPSQGISDYFAASSHNYTIRALDNAKRGLFQARTILELAEESMSMVYSDLKDIMDLTKEYFGSNNDDYKRDLEHQIDTLKSLAIQTIENTIFDGKKVLKDSSSNPLIDISIDPHDIGNKMTISFGEGVEVKINDIDLSSEDSANETIKAQIQRALGFMGQLNGFKVGIDAQININEIKRSNLMDAIQTAVGADDMDNVFELTKRQIQQQAAVSMLTQGNMMKGSVLNLIKFA